MIKEIVSLNLETITQNKTKNTSKGKRGDKGESHQAVSAWFQAYFQVLTGKGISLDLEILGSSLTSINICETLKND